MSKVCGKCENFKTCRTYCTYKAGESLAIMIANVPTIETKIGTPISNKRYGNSSIDTSGYVYCGAIVTSSSINGVTDIARDGKKVRSFENPFSSFDGVTASSMIKSFLDLNYKNDANSKEFTEMLMQKYYKLIQGLELPVAVPVGSELMMWINLDGKRYRERGKVISVSWRPNEKTGDIETAITCEAKAGGRMVTVEYGAKDFYEMYTVDKHTIGLPRTINTNGIFEMNKVGYILPMKIQDQKHTVYLDGHNMIYVQGDGTEIIIGSFGIREGFVEAKTLPSGLKSSDVYKVAKKIIPLVTKIRWFILPYGVADTHTIDATTYLEDCKKSESKE